MRRGILRSFENGVQGFLGTVSQEEVGSGGRGERHRSQLGKDLVGTQLVPGEGQAEAPRPGNAEVRLAKTWPFSQNSHLSIPSMLSWAEELKAEFIPVFCFF